MQNRNEDDKSSRSLVWTDDHTFQGWNCSVCEWNYPMPTLLNDPEAKTAYDRLATSKFRSHNCSDHLARLTTPADASQNFSIRFRKMVTQGFKPKDAVDLVLQEVSLESGNNTKTLAQARAAGEDFLRRLRAGLI